MARRVQVSAVIGEREMGSAGVTSAPEEESDRPGDTGDIATYSWRRGWVGERSEQRFR